MVTALDANGDGVIDADEIANASAALAKLDKNGDGKLTPDEFIGPRHGGPGGLRGPHGPPPKEILDKYDLNKDGKLDDSERAALHKDIEDGTFQPPPPPRGPGGPPPPPDAPSQQ
jgi:Ca2+-binding EF-hand superfamily protein